MNYYLDIETTGLDPLHAKIITIQYMELERNTAKPTSPLKILKEWESDEKTILKKFISDSGIADGYKFSFIPIGCNLQFEHSFFWQRCISNGLKPIDVLGRPFLDLKTVAVIMNRGEFKEPVLTILQTNLMVEAIYHNGIKKKNMQRLKVISRTKQRNFLVFAPNFTKNYPYY